MEFRYLGNSGLKISTISYGNWITHGDQIGEDTAKECVKRALDLGITTFDTADIYADTQAEEILGRALDLAGVSREKVEVFTKVYWPTGSGPNNRGLSRKHIMHSIDASLRRLRLDYIDLYQAHRFDVETPLEETMIAFADIIRQGKALYIGVSEWNADQITRGAVLARELRIPFISNQPQYSMLWRTIEQEVIPASQDVGMSQIVWSPMAQGILSGKYLPSQPPPAHSRRAYGSTSKFFFNDEILTRVQKLKPIAKEAGITMAQMAIAWVLQNQNVSSAIIGASRPEQLEENVKAAGIVLGADIMKEIDKVLDGVVISDPRKTKSPEVRP